MATLGDIANKARALTHSDTSSYTTANILIDINLWYQKVVSMILEAQDDNNFDDQRTGGSAGSTKTYPIATRSLVAGQRDYSFLSTNWTLQGKEGGSNQTSQSLLPLKIKRVDVTYDNVTWYRAMPLDGGQYPQGLGSITQEDGNFIKSAPYYDQQYNSIFLYPSATASDVSAGAQMRVELWRNIVPFTSADYSTDPNDSSSVPGFDPVFHMILAYGAAYEYANANNLPQLGNIKQDLADWEARLRTAYGKRDLDSQLMANYAYDYEFGR